MNQLTDSQHPPLSQLISEGKGDRAIARLLGVTRHKARELIREYERSRFAAPAVVTAGTGLSYYEAACRAVAEAKGFDEVREWEDKAAAVKEYSRRVKNRSLELDAMEIRERARLRRGQLLLELRTAGQLIEGRPTETVAAGVRITLEDLDITRVESSRDQRIAKMGGDSFERLIARCRAYAEEHPEKHSFDVLRAPGEPINGARSIMGSRQEPDDSLDYFPTPPWATRALFRYVMPKVTLNGYLFDTIWEPACGEGHIAEVCREYCENVVASDIHDYGYNDIVMDFLKSEQQTTNADWIITNPPFGDNAILFVRQAFKLAKQGVAMFFRSQWAVEGVERYEQIFRDNPPSLCAFFVERVNLCKGRWDPDGTTATAYCWLVWVQGAEPQAPLWIPPGCRELLTKPDDRERFTAQPVMKRNGR
jgi:hypothetical protein